MPVQADAVLRRMAVALEQLAAAEAQPRCAPFFFGGGRGYCTGATIEVVEFFWGDFFLGLGGGKKSQDVAGC